MPKQAAQTDWTVGPDDFGVLRANNSETFLKLVNEVEGLIRRSSFDLIRGQTDAVALLIMAQLAHVHHLAPV